MRTCFSMHSTFPHCIIDLPGTGLKLPLKTGTGGALLGDHSSLLADRHDPTPPPASLTMATAAGMVSQWLARPTVTVLSPGDRHWEILNRFLTEGQAQGSLVTDAHLAALAVEHGATIATLDRDFARFPGLRFFNPLLAELRS